MENGKFNVNSCHDVQLEGIAHVNINKFLLFCPNDPVQGVVDPFVRTGKGQLMRDGTFDFSPLPPQKKTQRRAAEKGGTRKTVGYKGRRLPAYS